MGSCGKKEKERERPRSHDRASLDNPHVLYKVHTVGYKMKETKWNYLSGHQGFGNHPAKRVQQF